MGKLYFFYRKSDFLYQKLCFFLGFLWFYNYSLEFPFTVEVFRRTFFDAFSSSFCCSDFFLPYMEIKVNNFKTIENPKKNTIFRIKNKNFYRKMQFSYRKTALFYRNSYFVYEKLCFS